MFNILVVATFVSLAFDVYCTPSVGFQQNIVTAAVDQLRKLVASKIPETSILHDFAKDDLFLQKWLTTSKTAAGAAQNLIQHVEWRKHEKIDELDELDWTYFQNEFPTVTGQIDKSGRPVAEMWLSDWNVRAAIVAGKRHQLSRYITRLVEQQQKELYQARMQGSNATHAVLLIDADGVTEYTFGCRECLQVFSYWGQDWETHYPELYGKVIAVNAPPSFQIIITTMKAVLRTSTMKTFEVIPVGQNANSKLDLWISPSQRSDKLGGKLHYSKK